MNLPNVTEANPIRHRVFIGWLVIATFLTCSTRVHAQSQPTPQDAIRKSFDAGGELPWYDSQKGQIAPVSVEPRLDDSANRDSRWIPKPAKPEQAKPQSGVSSPPPPSTNNVGFWEALGLLIQEYSTAIGWILFVIVVALLVGSLVYGWTRIETKAGLNTNDSEDEFSGDLGEADIERLEHLPQEVRQTTKNLLAEADRLWNSGQVDQAIIFLFGHRLLQLDRAGAIRLNRGKTNQQYLRELGTSTQVRQALRSTILLFEQSYFGRYAIQPEAFAEVRSEQEVFDQFLSTKTGKT